jgi:hypothetical protein
MHTPTMTPTLRVGRAWPLRVTTDLAEQLAALVGRTGSTLRQWRERRREAEQLDAAVELSEHTLRDMGAPEWLQSRAQARRDSQRFERELLRLEVRAGDTRQFY